jgi:hypothetical protein
MIINPFLFAEEVFDLLYQTNLITSEDSKKRFGFNDH